MSKKNILLLLTSFLSVFFISIFASPVHAATLPVQGYAWSDTVGWIQFNPTNNISNDVRLDNQTGDLNGYAWGDNIGWISFDATDSSHTPSAKVDSACIASNGTSCAVTGWARALTGGTAGSGGWDGWIQMSGTWTNGVTFNSQTGYFSGYAWGDYFPGWMDMSKVNSNPVTQYTLNVSKTGTGSGTVTSAPSGINCGSTCSASYNSGTSVTLTASASAGSTFAGWSGGGCSGTGTCTVTMNATQTVTATFNQPTLVISPPSASIQVGGTQQFQALCDPDGPSGPAAEQTVTSSANWSSNNTSVATVNNGLATGVSSGSAIISASYTCNTIAFTPTASLTVGSVTQYTLTVTKAGTGSGTVTSVPSGINCGSTCSASYNSGTSVTLTAAASAGSVFAGWSGGGCSGTGTCTVTMNATQTVTATFTLTTAPNPDLKGRSTSATFSEGPISITSGNSVILQWAPTNSPTSCTASGGWSGSKSTTGGTETITNVIANTTFTLSCTNAGGPGTDSFEVRILDVSLSANPSSGTAPLNGVDLTATVSGFSSGTYRYFFDCTNNGTNELDTGDITNNPYTATALCNYSSSGTYTAKVTVWHSEGTAVKTVTITVGGSAADFTIFITPSSQNIAQTDATGKDYTVFVNSLNSFNSAVSLSVSGCPSGATCSFWDTSITPPANASLATLLNIKTSNTSANTYTLTITGTSASLSHSTSVTLTVTGLPAFSLQSSGPMHATIISGLNAVSTQTTITVIPDPGFSEDVKLEFESISPSIAVTPHFSDTLLTASEYNTGSQFWLDIPGTTPSGLYTIKVKGTSQTTGSVSYVYLPASSDFLNINIEVTNSDDWYF